MLQIHLHENAVDRFSDCVSAVERVVDSLRSVVAFGAYLRRPSRDEPEQLVRLATSPVQGILTVDSPLLDSRPSALRHVLAAIRYQCWRQDLPVSFSVEPALAQRMASFSADPEPARDFNVSTQWGHKQAALLINFNAEIDDALGQAIDTRVRAWAAFCNAGAFCPDQPFEEMDEEFEPLVAVDSPALGVDWAEWSLTVFDITHEAVGVLVDEIATFNDHARCIVGVEIG